MSTKERTNKSTSDVQILIAYYLQYNYDQSNGATNSRHNQGAKWCLSYVWTYDI